MDIFLQSWLLRSDSAFPVSLKLALDVPVYQSDQLITRAQSGQRMGKCTDVSVSQVSGEGAVGQKRRSACPGQLLMGVQSGLRIGQA